MIKAQKTQGVKNDGFLQIADPFGTNAMLLIMLTEIINKWI